MILFFCLISIGLHAKKNPKAGILFFKGSWAELIKTAQQEGKPIFVDVYTDWCPPCKKMDKEIIPQQNVGNKYNASFINYKLDAEKGEGVAIAKQYGVGAYPTYLYLDAKGNLLHRAIGFFDAPDFIAHAETALSFGAAKNTIGSLDQQFKSGQKDPEFLQLYIRNMAELGLDNSEVFNTYLEVLPISKLSSADELLFLGRNIRNANSRAMVFLMANWDRLNEAQKKSLAPGLRSLLNDAMHASLKEGKPLAIIQSFTYEDRLKDYLSEKELQFVNRFKLLAYGLMKDTAGVKKTAYNFAPDLISIPLDSIKRKDKRRFDQIMIPFRSGKSDSTNADFHEERRYFVNLYSREITSNLYDATKAFLILEPADPALKDALLWAERINMIVPDHKLFKELEEKLHKQRN